MLAGDFVPSDLLGIAGNIEAGRFALDTLRGLPEAFRAPVKSRFSREGEKGAEQANRYIQKVAVELCSGALSVSSSDGEICDFAKARADEVRALLMAQSGAQSSEDLRALLTGYCIEFGVDIKWGILLPGIIGRMTDAGWWRRQVRRIMARKVEAHAINLGFVHRKAGLYASDNAVKRHAEQQARNRAAMEATEATNEAGLTMTLAELAAVSVANPRIRRGELMTRIAGFEDFAKAAGHVGMFYTATAPSRWHARLAKSGQRNPHYDEETTPKACAGYLSKTWAKARAWLHRRGISIYGFRVAEPHHDGTPHWHMLFFMAAEVVESVNYCLGRYFKEADAHELDSEKANEARFKAVVIDWARGSAAGYISKYIAKNIDGARNDMTGIGQALDETEDGTYEVGEADQTAPRVLAWASTWGIRQFQQIGGPGVTAWRELRRIRDMEHQADLFDTWSAADAGNWHAYTERQGGVNCRRDARPVQLWKVEPNEYADFNGEIQKPITKYGEPVGAKVEGVYWNRPTMGQTHYKTKLHTWEIRKAQKTGQAVEAMPADVRQGAGKKPLFVASQRPPVLPLTLGAWRPWSPVNNCTPPKKDADGNTIGAFSEAIAAPPISAAMREKIKAAEVAAVLNNIAAKQKRGGFGQFPRLTIKPGVCNA